MNDLEYCRTLKIESSTLQMWVEERWIIPGGSPEALSYEDSDLARGRLILDLVGSMGVNHAGVDVVIDLVDQLHSLRGRMRLLMGAIGEQDMSVQNALGRALRRD
jgi:chaperone modulatory protein CbpM